MLHLNLRDGDSTVRFGSPSWYAPTHGRMEPEEVARRVAGKRVLVLVHGYNVTDAFRAYREIQQRISDCYDVVIGVTWPGSWLSLAFWLARKRAGRAGWGLAAALGAAASEAQYVDLEGHSLGCRVALEACAAGLQVRNLILAAAAVDNEEIELGEQYSRAMLRADWVLVAHSFADTVLARAYRFAALDNALGLSGPENPARCHEHIESLDLSRWGVNHSDYKHSAPFFARWREIAK